MRGTRTTTLIAALAVLAGAAVPSTASGEVVRTKLSDERTLSRWAYANERAVVRNKPWRRSRPVGRLRYRTEDGLPELYLAISQRRSARTAPDWVKVRLPMRPNGRTGWVRREALGDFHRVRTHLRVNRRTLRATLYRRGRPIWRSRVGVGAPGTPTPGGRFYIRERLKGRFGTVYGPLAFGTSAYSSLSDWPGGGVIGIHGTNQPQLIPGRPSHGCIRVPNAAILRLARLMPLGTPVRIL